MKTVNELIVDYLPFANKLACEYSKKLSNKRASLDELKSAAYFGLVLSANRFDSSLDFSFATFSRLRILGEMQDYIRQLRGDRRKNYQTVVSLEDVEITNKSRSWDEAITDGLSDLAKNVVFSYYMEGLTLKEIGKNCDLSEGRISQILSTSHRYIEKQMAA